MNCLTKLFQQKRRRNGYILAFSGPMISKRDSSELFFKKLDNPSYNKVNYVFLHIIIKIKAMTKNTMANKLPRKLIQKMEIVGEQIKLARLQRNLSMAQVAERATCSEVTLCKVEKGLPTVSIGIFLRVLYALQLDDDILLLAKDDKLGRALQDMGLKNRQRASKKE